MKKSYVAAGDTFRIVGDNTVFIADRTGLIEYDLCDRNKPRVSPFEPFPITYPYSIEPLPIPKPTNPVNSVSLTKRELFAAMAMQGMLSSGHRPVTHEMAAEDSVKFANALIEELEKE